MRSGPSQSNCTKTKLAGRSSDSLELCIISTRLVCFCASETYSKSNYLIVAA
jgi:hypothetical protein